MYRAGIYNNPKNNDIEFNDLHQAELRCREKGKKDSFETYTAWDKHDQTVYLYLDYQEFEPRR
jgi:hypothetical protein